MKSALEAVRVKDKLPTHAAGYPMIYVSRGGNTLCADCADATTRDVRCSDPVVDGSIYCEDGIIDCQTCGGSIGQ